MMFHARNDMLNGEHVGFHSAIRFPHVHVSAQGPAHLRRLDVSSRWAANCSHVFIRLLSLTKHLMHFGYLKMNNTVRGEKVCSDTRFANCNFRSRLALVKNLALLVHHEVHPFWNMFSAHWLWQSVIEMFP